MCISFGIFYYSLFKKVESLKTIFLTSSMETLSLKSCIPRFALERSFFLSLGVLNGLHNTKYAKVSRKRPEKLLGIQPQISLHAPLVIMEVLKNRLNMLIYIENIFG